MTLVFASNNSHKLEEVRQIMPAGVEVLSLKDIGFAAEIEETGTTLLENSRLKAQTVWEWLKIKAEGEWRGAKVDGVFADDTGLEIDALDGKPGVYTARWYRQGAYDDVQGTKDMNEQEIFTANRAKALRELVGKTNRDAQFKTVITLIRQDETLQIEGVVRGRIAEQERGEGGFGYDPVFIPEGYNETFAELPAEIKNNISHRARALAKLVEQL
ncbi:MAG: RdgB/HAM1 family non-canonical purine NTP pyrophosphatase [Paludibacteraceae bacterium]|nr:RdgB/HAM1 family non-canonical purine NTP pyrophosphatase [Paludibacteraceae bacterium]